LCYLHEPSVVRLVDLLGQDHNIVVANSDCGATNQLAA